MTVSNIGCVICSAAITPQNDSAEHVIPQAIGGRWKIKGYICGRCNNRAGDGWDAVLAKQLEWLSSMIGVKRERGDAPNVPISTADGQALLLRADGSYIARKPEVVKTASGSTYNVSITARSMAEVRQHLRSIQKTHPDANVEEALAEATFSRRYVDSAFLTSIQFGGPEANASLIKTALAAAHGFGIPIEACDLALAYLRSMDGNPPVHFFFARDLVVGRPVEHFIHCVSISADPVRRLALAYIDYFGLWRSVVVLSSAYTGPALSRTYAIDPVRGEEVALDTHFSLSDGEVKAVLDGDDYPVEEWASLYNRTMPMVLARAEERHRHRLIEEAVDEAASAVGLEPGDDIPEDKQAAFVQIFSRLAAEKVMEMIQAKTRIPEPGPDLCV
jgi:hypothetical protein